MGIFKLNGIDYMGGGGGGNSNDRELTWDEYQALPDAEKYNDTNYYITDVNSDGTSNEFQPIIYSENEREIGVWTDGKPLYQKTVDCGYLPNRTTKNVSFGVNNIDKILYVNGIAYYSSGGHSLPLPYCDDASYTGNILVDANSNGTIRLICQADRSAYYGYVTIRYTKTTDQPGSGTWTPQGTPAVHYSTNEQIVGTWVDGSTIYERSINLGSFSVSSGGEYTIENVTGIDTFIKYTGYVVESGIKYCIPDPSIRIMIRTNNNLIFQGTGGSWSVSEGYITIRYTKQSSS